MKTITSLLISAVAITVATPALSQTIIAPTAATIDLGGPGFGSIASTFDQSGLSSGYTAGATNFDSYLATNPVHSLVFEGLEWFSNSGTTAATVTYDFGSAVGIDRLALWNEESSGIGSLSLSGSLDGISFSSFGTFSPTDNPLADYPADVFAFTALTTRYVRFEMSGCPQPNPGSFSACAIGEVAFRSADAVPEPATWALMVAGFGLVGSAMRRRRSRQAAFA